MVARVDVGVDRLLSQAGQMKKKGHCGQRKGCAGRAGYSLRSRPLMACSALS